MSKDQSSLELSLANTSSSPSTNSPSTTPIPKYSVPKPHLQPLQPPLQPWPVIPPWRKSSTSCRTLQGTRGQLILQPTSLQLHIFSFEDDGASVYYPSMHGGKDPSAIILVAFFVLLNIFGIIICRIIRWPATFNLTYLILSLVLLLSETRSSLKLIFYTPRCCEKRSEKRSERARRAQGQEDSGLVMTQRPSSD